MSKAQLKIISAFFAVLSVIPVPWNSAAKAEQARQIQPSLETLSIQKRLYDGGKFFEGVETIVISVRFAQSQDNQLWLLNEPIPDSPFSGVVSDTLRKKTYETVRNKIVEELFAFKGNNLKTTTVNNLTKIYDPKTAVFQIQITLRYQELDGKKFVAGGITSLVWRGNETAYKESPAHSDITVPWYQEMVTRASANSNPFIAPYDDALQFEHLQVSLEQAINDIVVPLNRYGKSLPVAK